MQQLEGKVALIIGGSKGMGFAVAQLFAENGASVIITGRCQKTLDIAKEQLPGCVHCMTGDITKLADIDNLFNEIGRKYNGLDILFSNAGLSQRILIDNVTEEDFDKMVSVNYKGTFFVVQRSLPYLKKGASIILNASIAGMIAFDHHSVYSSSKAAVIHLAKVFAADLASRKIRVNSISPGYIRTSAWDPWLNSGMLQSFAEEVPLGGKLGSAEEVAQTVLFLATDASSYITGQNFVIDGGISTIFRRYQKK
jgi:NAD(P)-dependent dehydrogenase (short-subunit alcohol dehydrogenase family)